MSHNSVSVGDKATGDKTGLAELRSSCEPCHNSKLRCNREKPVCARCQKTRMNCTYAPTKRVGRPRKVQPPISGPAVRSNGKITLAEHDAPSPARGEVGSTSTESISISGRESVGSDKAELEDPAVADQTTQPLDPISTASVSTTFQGVMACDFSAVVDDDIDMNLDGFDFSTTTDDLDPSAVHPSLTPPGIAGLSAPSSWPIGDIGMNLEPLGDLQSSQTALGTSRQSVEALLLESSWSSGNLPFADGGIAQKQKQKQKQWDASISRPLLLSLDSSGSTLTQAECACHGAMADLFLHRKRARETQPESALEVCLQLHTLLHTAWVAESLCDCCRNDDLIKLVTAGVASETVDTYRAIVNDLKLSYTHERTSRASARSSIRQPQLSPPPLFLSDYTRLSFGSKTITGVVKHAFLRRLIRSKVKQTSLVLEQLFVAEVNQWLGAPLRALILSIQERINIILGMLSMME